jgi:hypothetical protein
MNFFVTSIDSLVTALGKLYQNLASESKPQLNIHVIP